LKLNIWGNNNLRVIEDTGKWSSAMIRCLFAFGIFSWMVLSLFPYQALALMIGLSTEDLTRASQTVIMGEVKDVKSQWNEDGSAIVTRATVVVSEAIKGKVRDSRVTVEYKGGEVGEVGMRVSDSPALRKGENVILFLKPDKETRVGLIRSIVGRAQGMYSIGNDGIARKMGFTVMDRKNAIDNDIPVSELVDKIRAVR